MTAAMVNPLSLDVVGECCEQCSDEEEQTTSVPSSAIRGGKGIRAILMVPTACQGHKCKVHL